LQSQTKLGNSPFVVNSASGVLSVGLGPFPQNPAGFPPGNHPDLDMTFQPVYSLDVTVTDTTTFLSSSGTISVTLLHSNFPPYFSTMPSVYVQAHVSSHLCEVWFPTHFTSTADLAGHWFGGPASVGLCP
jgi:hypothetical protein